MSLKSVGRTYERLGREDPLFAVLSDKRYRNNRWDPEEFFQTGQREIAQVLGYLRDLNLKLGRERALDFGCGVGRLTQPLAAHFDDVVGIDISESMLEHARKYNREFNDRHERLRFIANKADDLQVLETDSVDLVYSNITLQHIPPPHSHRYIAEFFRVLRPGGVAVFMVPSGRSERSAWRAKLEQLKRGLRQVGKRVRGRALVEIHFIPQPRVQALIEQAGGTLKDVVDLAAGEERGSGPRLRYCATC